MKFMTSRTALTVAAGLAAAGVLLTTAPAQALDPTPPSTARYDRDGVGTPHGPVPVYGPHSPGPVFSQPRTVTVIEPQSYVVTRSYQPALSDQPYVVARSAAPVVVPQTTTVYTPRAVTSQGYYVYQQPALVPVAPLGAGESLRVIEALRDAPPAAGPSNAAARAEFELLDRNNDGSISGDEYVYYAKRFGEPKYWNY